jgi:AraC-like DNA-binding protein
MDQVSDSKFEGMATGLLMALADAPADPIGGLSHLFGRSVPRRTDLLRNRRNRRHGRHIPQQTLMEQILRDRDLNWWLSELQRRAAQIVETRCLTAGEGLTLCVPMFLLCLRGSKDEFPRSILSRSVAIPVFHLRRKEHRRAFRRALLMGGLTLLFQPELAMRFSLLATSKYLKIEELAVLLKMNHRTLQRLANSEKLPECYRTKGGHWRISLTEKTRRWLTDVRCAQLAASLEECFSEEWVSHAHTWTDIMEMGDVSVCAKTLRSTVDHDRIAVVKTVHELEIEGEPTIEKVARAMGLSPASFKRLGLHHILRDLKKQSAAADVLAKDPRAKRLYKNQILQETENEGDDD